MNDSIKVSDEALNKLRNALMNSGTSYKDNLRRLSSLMEEITSGDIQGTLATELLNKFQSKKETFHQILNTIEDAEEYAGVRTKKFGDMVDNTRVGMQ